MSTTTALRPLTTGELLDRTFALYKEHFVLFVGIVALPHLISLALQLSRVSLRPQTDLSAVLSTALWSIGVAMVTLIVRAWRSRPLVLPVGAVAAVHGAELERFRDQARKDTAI